MDLCPLHSHFVIFFPVSEAPFMWVLLHACGVSIAILEDGALALAFSSRLCTPKMSDHPLQLSFRSIPRCDRASRAEPRATRSALYHVPGLVLQHLYSHPLRTRIPVVYGSSPVQADSSRNKRGRCDRRFVLTLPERVSMLTLRPTGLSSCHRFLIPIVNQPRRSRPSRIEI